MPIIFWCYARFSNTHFDVHKLNQLLALNWLWHSKTRENMRLKHRCSNKYHQLKCHYFKPFLISAWQCCHLVDICSSIYLSILHHPHCWVLCTELPEVEESQDISQHSRDMPVKPPRPEGDCQSTYNRWICFHINILSLAGLEPVWKRYVAQ